MRTKKLFFMFAALMLLTLGSAHGVSINIMRPGTTEPIQITMDTVKRTTRALAVRLSGKTDVYYANMMPVENSWAGGNLFVRHDNQTYQVGVTPKFFITTTPNTISFSFKISARGSFYIDWGDGNVETFFKNNTTNTTYSHTYASAGEHKIGIGGHATAYNTGTTTAAISFSSNTNIAKIDGSLGAIFGTIGTGASLQQPRFYNSFNKCSNLTTISENLFAGITGAPISRMFGYTFRDCTLLSTIPENLFSGIQGAPSNFMFIRTFSGCTKLEHLPENLFAGIQGAPASSMFSSTFMGCTGLTEIPEKLFAGIEGAPASSMFYRTFYECSGLRGKIPENLFAKIEGTPASSMFQETFYACSNLNGEIPEKLFAGIKDDPATSMFEGTFWQCNNITSIPDKLFAKIKGAPASSMFKNTFANTNITSVPANLFAGIKGQPASSMFYSTFSGCWNLTGTLPENLFAGIEGTPAADMFNGTFYTTGITGIPENFFGDISGPAANNMFVVTFGGCRLLTGLSARINGKFLYEIWPDNGNSCYFNSTNLEDYNDMPPSWNTR